MNFKSKVVSCRIRIPKTILLFTFAFLLFTFACSIPNLETSDCGEARNSVKELYSYHFGNDMKFTKENLKLREKFLSNELKQKLESQPDSTFDYFTETDDYPKAFRIGSCKIVEQNKKVNMQIVLFWKTDTRSEQREVSVEVIRENDAWLVNNVENKQ